MNDSDKAKQGNTVRDYFNVTEVFTYFFRKKDPQSKPGIYVKMMHGINKFSIIVFLIAFIIWLIKRLI